MNLLCVGISHHTAPLEIRERLWYSEDEVKAALPKLRQGDSFEAVMFSTCNRTEVYAYSPAEDTLDPKLVRDFLCAEKGVADISEQSFRTYTGAEAIEHLYSVASGIDSLVIGDVQILAQVKEGLAAAVESGNAGFFLSKLFQSAFHTAKRARSGTRIGEGAVSVSYAAVELAERIFESFAEKSALVIGAGDTAQLTAKHLRSRNIGKLYITNRTAERSQYLAGMVGGTAIPYETYAEKLPGIDIIVSSVSSDQYVLTTEALREVNKRRESGALFIIDIGVPRNIDPKCKDLENVFLYDLDSLNGLVRENELKRVNEISKVKRIIAEEQAEFIHWMSGLHATPTIAALTELIEGIRKEEVQKNINRFDPRDRDLVELVTKRIVNKILHAPIVNLKNGQDEHHSERLHKISALRKLFGIDGKKDAEHGS
ncbi:MAG TPA: glutamyl-tRNA reductase [Bacteroidota bacterium]